ncbi:MULTISPECIES: phosphotransferase family protein [unclassified Streptomyces]|uniref:phosphotransferase family protein n=1 Tax=unclassified Streptomyces TaxID=2593676 RepID=UPI00224FFA07|nr:MULTISPECIES: phosphotransferase [unclassified Streptomyces]MCX5056348.1 aminoglycoside phosphotransferase family protein [Streptomyces sp. NBC_00452]MCX5287453.1 aminoglycoside phosphotransferase family protein [Streptomyces sp. NBC_00183]
MQGDVSQVVDRGRYPEAVTPWEREEWRAAAVGWVSAALAARGLRESGPRQVRLRPWSVLVRLSVGEGVAVWFKANPPGSLFEAGLTRALAGWAPRQVLRPLAVDADRGWSLLPHGGRRFADVLEAGEAGPEAWEEMLRQYAGLQRALMPHAAKIESLGVPGARTRALPDVLDRLVAENEALTDGERATLAGLRPRMVEWCAELAELGIGDCLDHADLHEGQVFFAPSTGRFTFFDWGDAAVSHPFCSFLVPARQAVERYGADVLPRLRDAYLEPWAADGHTLLDLRRALRLAWRLGPMGRAWSWGRLFPGASDGTGLAGGTSAARSLLDLTTEPPFAEGLREA